METTEITQTEMTQKALATYSPSDAAIAQMRERYMVLAVNGEDDKEGCAAVRAARLDIKAHRVAIEKTRKALKEDALRYGQAVDGEARRLTSMLEPIEAHLQEQEDIVAKAAERRRLAEEAAKSERLKVRMTELTAVQSWLPPEDVRDMSDEKYALALDDAKRAHARRIEAERLAAEQRAAEEARLAAERAEIERQRQETEARMAAERAEADRIRREAEVKLAAERAEIERQQAAERERLAAEARRLADERAAVEAAKREQERLAEIKAAEERAAVKAREDAAREAERQAAETARREAMRPINERLRLLAGEVEALSIPEFPSSGEVRAILDRAASDIRSIASR